MSKHENILDSQSVAVPRPGELSSIGAIFSAWLSASDTAHDPKAPQAAKDRAKERMSML